MLFDSPSWPPIKRTLYHWILSSGSLDNIQWLLFNPPCFTFEFFLLLCLQFHWYFYSQCGICYNSHLVYFSFQILYLLSLQVIFALFFILSISLFIMFMVSLYLVRKRHIFFLSISSSYNSWMFLLNYSLMVLCYVFCFFQISSDFLKAVHLDSSVFEQLILLYFFKEHWNFSSSWELVWSTCYMVLNLLAYA